MTANTQSFVPIREVRDDLVIREDGVYCAILLVSSINFALKSTDEQDAILYQFQALLDSLEVSTQILIRSRRINISPYLDHIEEIKEKQQNELLRLQTDEYIKFIQYFTDNTNIMAKNFFIVINLSSYNSTGNMFSFLSNKEKKQEEEFEQNKFQLLQRVSFVISGLRSIGLRCTQLSTEHIVDVLEQTFNPSQQGTMNTK